MSIFPSDLSDMHTAIMAAYVETKREELESAIAEAEAARQYLEAALAKAEAALIDTVTNASKIDANRAEAAAKVDKARARCRQLYAALVEPGHSEFITRSRRRIGTPFKQSGDLSKPSVTTSPPSIPSSEHTVGGGSKTLQEQLLQQPGREGKA
jgi:DNA-binding phage protein